MDTPMKFALLINRFARHQTAGKRWLLLRDQVLARLPPGTREVLFDPPFDLDACLADLFLRKKADALVSVGGDGTMNAILHALLRHPEWRPEERYLGGIGLGSSNDFIKPAKDRLSGAPVRLDWEHPCLSDVGKMEFITREGSPAIRYFLLNASAGVTAQANLLFNREDAVLRRLKPWWTQGAILYTVIKILFTHRNTLVSLQWDGQARKVELSNLAILKVPFVSGDFRYDQDIRPADGWLGLNYCHGMTRLELIRALFDLGRGKFPPGAGRVSEKIKQLRVEFSVPAPVETDGEVTEVTGFEVSLIPRAIRLMGIGLPLKNEQT